MSEVLSISFTLILAELGELGLLELALADVVLLWFTELVPVLLRLLGLGLPCKPFALLTILAALTLLAEFLSTLLEELLAALLESFLVEFAALPLNWLVLLLLTPDIPLVALIYLLSSLFLSLIGINK